MKKGARVELVFYMSYNDILCDSERTVAVHIADWLKEMAQTQGINRIIVSKMKLEYSSPETMEDPNA